MSGVTGDGAWDGGGLMPGDHSGQISELLLTDDQAEAEDKRQASRAPLGFATPQVDKTGCR